MYLEGTAAAWVLFLMGFLTCGFLGLIVWNLVNALQMKLALKLLNRYLDELDRAE